MFEFCIMVVNHANRLIEYINNLFLLFSPNLHKSNEQKGAKGFLCESHVHI